MKIGIIGSIWIRIPPKDFGFGAQEYLIYQLAEGLLKRGHEVTIFTTSDAKTNARVESVAQKQIIDLSPADNKIKDTFELINLSHAYKMAGKFDLFHNHLLPYGLLFADLFKIPTVHTLHHEIYHISDTYIYRRFKDQKYVSISDSQRKIMPELNYVSTVYNGIDPEFYKFKEIPDDNYLFYIGRIKRYKGIHTAIQVALKLGLKLKIAGPQPNPNQPDFEVVNEYWYKDIKPHLDTQTQYVGEASGEEKIELLQNAKALILPVERDEPFGMSVIEAMSCGTPVIVYGRGAMPELVKDGKTGFIVREKEDGEGNKIRAQNIVPLQINGSGIDGLCQAVQKIYNMPSSEYLSMRKNSHDLVQQNFTIDRMVEGYEKVYKKILDNGL